MWTLVLLVVGISNTLTNVVGFKSQASCEIAGQTSTSLISGTNKEIRFVCLEVK